MIYNILISLGLLLTLFLTVCVCVVLIRKKINFQRSLNMVFFEIKLPKADSKEDKEADSEQHERRDFKESSCGVMSDFFTSIHSSIGDEWYRFLVEQESISFEFAVIDGLVHYYIGCSSDLAPILEKQVLAYYPTAIIEQTDDYNIFNKENHVVAGSLELKKDFIYPLKTFNTFSADPMNTLISSLSKISHSDGVAIQLLVRPEADNWQKKGRKLASDMLSNKDTKGNKKWYNPLSWLSFFFNVLIKGEVSNEKQDSPNTDRNTPHAEDEIKEIDNKNSKVGFDTRIRIVCSSATKREAQVNLLAIKSAFTQYSSINSNALSSAKISSKKIISMYILRTFPANFFRKKQIFSVDELSSIYHFPNSKYNKTTTIAWQNYKIVPTPINIPEEGLFLGYNIYRGVKRKVCMKRSDRFRHFYLIGQTGTGKSSMFELMIQQDFKNGEGLCVVDPHGSLIDNVLPYIPRERADDVIYFNPADIERPLGLNLLEASNPDEAEMVALDAMNIMIKLFDEEIFGPRIQDYFRNGCLTLMSDPEGGCLTDIVRLFTDDAFAKTKRKHITNPIVASFWDNQMAKTGEREKAEMIPYFAAKFGQFITNGMIRNIIGQTKSAFNFLDVMQQKKILLMNLSKGSIGDINSNLLGLITIQKIQMAAFKRALMSSEERQDFFLYIDEFQNYVTDSIESILSEARKYRLSLNMAHQYLAQIDSSGKKKGVNLKDAVFGNVGTIMSYKIGAQDAEFLAKEMAPVFTDFDLINMDKFKAVMKLSVDTQPSRPFSLNKIPYAQEVPGDFDAAKAFIQLSRLKYGREREFVEREILRRIGVF
jgi:hypothetical protein